MRRKLGKVRTPDMVSARSKRLRKGGSSEGSKLGTSQGEVLTLTLLLSLCVLTVRSLAWLPLARPTKELRETESDTYSQPMV